MADSFQAEANQRKRLRCENTHRQASAAATNHPHSALPHTTQPQNASMHGQGNRAMADRPLDCRLNDAVTATAGGQGPSDGDASAGVDLGETDTSDGDQRACYHAAALSEGTAGREDVNLVIADDDSGDGLGRRVVKSLSEAQELAKQLKRVGSSSEGGRVVMWREGRMLAKFLRTKCQSN